MQVRPSRRSGTANCTHALRAFNVHAYTQLGVDLGEMRVVRREPIRVPNDHVLAIAAPLVADMRNHARFGRTHGPAGRRGKIDARMPVMDTRDRMRALAEV